MPRQSVLFLIDTQGANCVGCYASDLGLRTPNLDRLAQEAIRFDRAYTCSPVCGPARSAIFTGLYPHSNGVLGNDEAPHAGIPTLGQRLTNAGIHCGYIGKWHLDGSDYFGDGRCADGWDPRYWFDGRNHLESLPDQHARDLSRQVLDRETVRREGIDAGFTWAHQIANRAIEFIHQYRDEDFLLVVSIDEPHHPFICPEPFVGSFDDFVFPVANAADSLENKPLVQREWARRFPHAEDSDGVPRNGVKHPAYFACNSFSDHEVGRVLEALRGHAPDALIIYTADHGDMLGSHGLWGKGPAMYEEIIRIPFIVKSPSHNQTGCSSQALVSHIDLVPTLLDFHGVRPPDLLQGRSLLSLFCGGTEVRETVCVEFNRYEVDHDGFGAFQPIRCIHTGRFKLAINLLDTDELYDLTEDPGELVNRIHDDALQSVRDRLHDRLLEWMDSTRDPLRGPHWARRPWRDVSGSSWEGPTRPRPADPEYFPPSLLYDTGRVAEKPAYDK